MFNGSTSLRDAAGQLIEEVVKSVRRKETVDDAYMENLYAEVQALYRLNEYGGPAEGKVDLGPLPGTAKALLGALAAAWVLILLYLAVSSRSRRRKL